MDPRFEISHLLIEQALAGDSTAQNLLWDRLLANTISLTKIIGRKNNITRSSDLEDITQNVLLSILAKKEKLKDVENIQSWLWRIVHNHCVNHIRQSPSDRQTESLDAPVNEDCDLNRLNFLPCWGHQTAAIIREELEFFLNTLSKEKSDIFRLYISGYSYEEIAGITMRNIKTVGVEIYRIKKLLEKYWDIQP